MVVITKKERQRTLGVGKIQTIWHSFASLMEMYNDATTLENGIVVP